MVHVGEEEFYSDVKSRVSNSDIILTEGVKSKTSKILTLSYRLIEKNRSIGLTTQPRITSNQAKGRILHADVSSSEFENKWKRLPLLFRLKLSLLFPAYGLYLRFFGTRNMVAKNMNTEMLQGRSDLLDEDEDWEKLQGVLLDWRDGNLLSVLKDTLEDNQSQEMTISIVYGAEHMRAIMIFLLSQSDYRVVDSEWLDVIRI